MRNYITTLMLVGAVICQSAYPFDCTGPQRGQQVIFEGTVIRATPVIKRDAYSGVDRLVGVNVTFKVTRPIKGPSGGQVTIFVRQAVDDGYPFLCHKSYRVYARTGRRGLQEDECYEAKPLSPGVKPAAEIQEVLVGGHASLKQQAAVINQMICR